jgi:Cu(I)/Ag(I) efflux system membrane fusion protein
MGTTKYMVSLIVAAFFLLVVAGFSAPGAEDEGKVLYWTCGMHPSVRAEGPGKCPICNMDLVPVRAGEGHEEGHVSLTLSERARELAGVRTSPVDYLPLVRTIRAVGKLEYDERKMANISAWVSGRIDRLFVDFTGVEVQKGDPLMWVYSPGLVTAQEEYLLSRETAEKVKNSPIPETVSDAHALLESSRQKLLLMGITQEQIQELEARRTTESHVVITAPATGTVIHKTALEGQYVKGGQHLFKIADLSHLWMIADVFETDHALVQVGQEVEVTTPSYPGEIFHGRIAFIDPFLDESSRSVHIRVDVPNPGRKLKPGLSVDAIVQAPLAQGVSDYYTCPMHPHIVSDKKGECPECGMFLENVAGNLVLAVPKSAVLDVGSRKLVYLDEGNGKYTAREVVVGPEAEATGNDQDGKFFPVLEGLAQGDRVVTRANFLIDSQTQLTGEAAGAYGGALEAEDQPAQHAH